MCATQYASEDDATKCNNPCWYKQTTIQRVRTCYTNMPECYLGQKSYHAQLKFIFKHNTTSQD